MLAAHEVVDRATVVGVADHDRGAQFAAILQSHATRGATLDDHAVHGSQRAHLAATGLDHLDQPGGDHLTATFRVERAAHVVMDDPGVHRDRRLLRPTGVQAAPVVDRRTHLVGEFALVEQLTQRATRPQLERRTLATEDIAALLGHLAQGLHAPLDAGLLGGELLDEALLVFVPTGGHAEREVGEVQRVEPVCVERAELQSVADAEAGEDRGEQPARLALADVVHPDVELVPVVTVMAPEHLSVATGDVVALEHQHPLACAPEAGGGGEPARPRSDDDRIPRLGCHGTSLTTNGGRRRDGRRRP
ncbi:unannotated protein [freshwater metagenome]|uniref:Unannotated protein n=1 Tax=freshwater metagenome TaxID=449393 RepID=A0A6J7QJV1_9ZZZZ